MRKSLRRLYFYSPKGESICKEISITPILRNKKMRKIRPLSSMKNQNSAKCWLKKQIIASEVRLFALFFVLLHSLYVWRPLGAQFFSAQNDMQKQRKK